MAIFSVVHLWAYPWREYELRQSRIATSEPDSRVAHESATSYSGGLCGTSALLDVFNLWDMVKGVARAFKWFVVDRPRREQDVSYINSSLAIALQPVRKVFALQFSTQEDRLLHHQCHFPVNDLSPTRTGGSSTCNDSCMIQEQEAVEEEHDFLSKAHPDSPRSSFLSIPPSQHQIIHNGNEGSTNDTSTVILPLESSIHLPEPGPPADAPQLTLPEFRAFEIGLQEEDQTKQEGEDPNLAPAQRQAQPSVTESIHSSNEPTASPPPSSLESLRG